MWTEEQYRAINEKDADILVAAAAGSGKTAVLVERIIGIICDEKTEVDIDELLVLTFTKAAAAQMRERISKTLSKKIEEQPDSQRLQKQLALINRAQITTIDSFCLKVVKENYMHIDIDPAFRIADEKECDLIKSDVLENLFEDRYTDENNEKFLELVEIFGEATGDNSLKQLVLLIHQFVQSNPFPKQWLNMAAENFNISENRTIKDTIWGNFVFSLMEKEIDGIILKCDEALNIMNNEEGVAESYINAISSDKAFIVSIKNMIENDFDEAVRLIQNVKYANIGRIKAGIHSAELAEKIKTKRKDIKDAITEIGSKYLFEYSATALSDVRDLYPTVRELMDLVMAFSAEFKAVKKEKLLVDFSDMEHYALEVLLEKGSTVENLIPTKVALNMQKKYYEVMTDEYQDSNLVQEMLLCAISGDRHNRFMVGDVKQSIYGFRQAAPEIFMGKYNTYKDSGNSVRIDLYKNFRSRENILAGINLIFSQIMSEELGGLVYDEKTALYPGASFPDFEQEEKQKPIEFYLINRKEEEVAEESDEEEMDSSQLELAFVAKRIKQLFAEKFQVLGENGKYRSLKYSDIVILLRAAKNWGNAAAEALANEGIPVFAPTESAYFKNTEISFILSILRVIDNSRQDISIMASLKGVIYGVTDDELIKIKLFGGMDSFYENVLLYSKKEEADQLAEKLLRFVKDIARWKELSVFTTVSSLLWTIYNETGYFDYVGIKTNGAQRQANLKLLTQKAKNLECTSFKGLFNFIRYIEKLEKFSEDNSEAYTLSENDNLVKITTIHKSKGLEYPIVFVCGLGKKSNQKDLNNTLLMSRQMGIGLNFTDLDKRVKYNTISKTAVREKLRQEAMAEEMRVLYVALTRAKEKLILTCSSRDANKLLEKVSAICSCQTTLLPSYTVLKSTSYMEWILSSLVRQKDGAKLIEEAQIVKESSFSNEAADIYNHSSKWQVSLIERSSIAKTAECTEIIEALKEEAKKTDDSIFAALDYEYQYKNIYALPANVSVSEIKRNHMSDMERKEAEDLTSTWQNMDYKKPMMFVEKTDLSSSQKGTAIHTVMEHLDLKHQYCLEEIKSVVENLKDINILSKEEADSINANKILKFFKSPLGQMLQKAETVYKEESFAMELMPSQIYGEAAYSGVEEKILTHGIIDCFFMLEGKLVLYDYKTDYVPLGEEEELVKKYKIQLKIYKNALERTINKTVDEVYIYSFHLDKAIKV